MRVVILAAGYGTRLERDLREDGTGLYTHLVGIPKPLLPIGQHPLLSHWIHTLDKCESIVSDIVVVVNDLHRKMYEKWAENSQRKVHVISDGSSCNDHRSGAVACMQLGLTEDKDTVFIAGDTLFGDDFAFDDIILKFKRLKEEEEHKEMCLILSAPVAEENVSKHGIIEVSEMGRVTKFFEKPNASETASRLQCPCFYVMSAECQHHLKDFLENMKNEPLKARDATGMFVSWLIHVAPVYAHHVGSRHDVGGLQSYISCHQAFLQKV